MINAETKKYVLDTMMEDTQARFDENLKGLNLLGFMKEDNVDLVKEAVNKIKSNVIASIPEGVPVPATSMYVSCTGSGNEITVINISLNNKVNAKKKFKFAKSFVGENVVDLIAAFLRDVYIELVVDLLAEDNLEVINSVIEEAAKATGVPYKVSLTTQIGGTNNKLSFISDDEVVFFVDMERVFGVDDLLALQEPSEFISEDAIAGAKQQIADSLSAAQTTEQLVAEHGGVFIGHLANISKNTKPMTMIKQVTNKNIENVVGNKDALYYYSKDDVFALVARREGKMEVILTPFNTETFHKENIDVLKAIQ